MKPKDSTSDSQTFSRPLARGRDCARNRPPTPPDLSPSGKCDCAPGLGIKENSKSVQSLSISRVKPNSHNSRTHSAKQIRQIANSIVAFGFRNPLLVSEDGELIAGHGRYQAAKLLGLANVPAIVVA